MKYLVALAFALITGNCLAQSSASSVINSSGGTSSQNSIIYEWSIGELALVETMITNAGVITNGMLQPVPPIHTITDGFPLSPSNILTSNGDGKNDAWVIEDLEKYPENELSIYDRAGRIIYQTKNYKNDWTGDLSGLPLAEDTYFYILKLIKNGQTAVKKGFITILN